MPPPPVRIVPPTAEKPFDDRLPEPEKASAHEPKPWPFDVQSYDLMVNLEPKHRKIVGQVTIQVDDREDGLLELPLDAVDMRIRSVRDDTTESDVDCAYDGRTLRIPFPSLGHIGTRRQFTVAYEAQPVRGIYFNEGDPPQIYSQGECEDSRYWFPCHDAPDDRAVHSIDIVAADSSWPVLAAGEGDPRGPPARSVSWVRAGFKSFHIDVPHVSYLTTLVAGPYTVLRESGVVPLQFFVEPRDAKYVPASFRKTDAILRFFGDYTGLPYPYPKYSQTTVRNFMFGGMENISATTLTDAAIHPPEWEPARSSTSLVAHEAAHQWFGDWITCSDWSHCWLNEGFATYFDALFQEHDEGRDAFLWTLRGLRHDALNSMDSKRRAVVSNVYADPFDLFDGHAYAGGAVRLHMLRHLLGDDPFRGAIRHYVKKCGLSCITTDDFQKAVEEFTGQDLAWFFDQWFRRPGYPVLKVRWKWDDAKKAVLVTVEQTQKAEGGVPEAYRLPLDVKLDWRQPEIRRLDVTKRIETFEIPATDAPALRVDPESALLARFDLDAPVDELLRGAQADPNVSRRIDAIEALAAIVRDEKRTQADRDRAFVALKITEPEDVDFPPLRAAWAAQLAARKDDATAAVLMDAVNVDSDLRVRLAAMDALAGFENNEKARTGLASYLDHPNDLLRAAAVAGVARLKHPLAFESLMSQVERPGWQSVVRVAALKGFADLGDERAFETLVRYAAPGDNWSRTMAIESLGRMGRKRAEHRDAVMPYLDDAERGVRQKAAEALGTMADPDTIPTLCAHFQTETWPAVKNSLRNAVKSCRAAAVESGRLVTAEAVRAAEIRERHAAMRDEADGVEKSLATLAGDEKTRAETRLKSMREQMAQMQRDLDVLGVPVKPKEKPATPSAR